MILGYPRYDEVERYTTFELVRAKTLLPPPTHPHEIDVMKLVDKRLAETGATHRGVIEAAVGYGP